MVLRNLHSSVWHTMTSSTAHKKFPEAAMHGPLSHIRVGRCMPEKPFSPGWAVACLASMADQRICLHQTLCAFLQNPTPNYPLLIISSLYKFLSGARPPLHHSTLLQTPISVHGRKTPKCQLSWRCAQILWLCTYIQVQNIQVIERLYNAVARITLFIEKCVSDIHRFECP